MREYETPLNERIQKAIDASSHPGYTKSLKMLLRNSNGDGDAAEPIGDFIGGEAGNGYGYNYGYDYQ